MSVEGVSSGFILFLANTLIIVGCVISITLAIVVAVALVIRGVQFIEGLCVGRGGPNER